MKLIKNVFLYTVFVTVLISVFVFSSSAFGEKEIAVDKFYSQKEKLLCISHRGDTADYPENSLEGVKSALKKGADFVSVNLEKTSDGVFYLCEDESLGNVCNAPYESLFQMKSDEVIRYNLYDIYGKETEYKMTSLETLLNKTNSEDGLILDVKPEYKDEVYSVLKKNDALFRVIIRVKESGSELTEWAQSKDEKVYVIGKYTGNIIFSTVSQINSLTECEMPAVQYESKNYFNVAYGLFFANRYLSKENARAVAATYSPDLCGQRFDNADSWNELIGKGYSVIETNNIESFVAYRDEADRLTAELSVLLGESEKINTNIYSQVSLSNLEKARKKCENLLSDSAFSLGEAQKAYSQLVLALKEMKISAGEVDTRGALNVTPGKVIAAVLVGLALLSGQIYVFKMRKSNKEKKTTH